MIAVLAVTLVLKSTPIPVPDFPFLVVIKITPLEPLYPYNADAALPFNTEIEAISSGLKEDIPSPLSTPPYLPAFPCCALSIGIPSTTYKGWLDPEAEVAPRIITRLEPDGPEAGAETFTPATLPCNAFPKFTSLVLVKSSPFTSPTAYPNAFFCFFTPNEVITISFNSIVPIANKTVILFSFSATSTVFEMNPTEDTVSVTFPEGIITANFPSESVIVLMDFPFTFTVAETIPLFPASATTPVTDRFCAIAPKQLSITNPNTAKIRFISNLF